MAVNESLTTVTFVVIKFDITPDNKRKDNNTLKVWSYKIMELKDRRKT